MLGTPVLRKGLLIAGIVGCLGLLVSSCASANETSRSAMSVESDVASSEASPPDLQCPDGGGIDHYISETMDTLTMRVCEWASFPADAKIFTLKTSNPDVLWVGDYEQTAGGDTVKYIVGGGGVVAVAAGQAQVTLYDPDSPDTPVSTIQVIVEP